MPRACDSVKTAAHRRLTNICGFVHVIVMLGSALLMPPSLEKILFSSLVFTANPLSSIYQSTDTCESFFCHKF